jgi:LacI family transcriptional regulator
VKHSGSTISQVAAQAGVSAATVSRVFNGSPRVSEETRNQVLRAAEVLGYRPSAIARSLATRRGIGVGMVVGDLGEPYYAPMMRAAERELRARGQMLIVASGYNRREGELSAIEFLRDQRCAALLIHAGGLTDAELVELADDDDVDVVVINRRIADLAGRCVWVDHAGAGRLAARYLIEAGHRALATVTGPLHIADAADRHEGFVAECRSHGIAIDAGCVIEGDYSLDSGARATRALLASGRPFTALFCGNDNMAVAAVEMLQREGVGVPGEVSVVGYDNAPIGAHSHPPLTTVEIPLAALGHAAAHLALARSGLAHEPVQQAFGGRLLERASVQRRQA